MNASFWYILNGNPYRYDWGPITLTKTQSSPTYKWAWSGGYNQQAWVELDTSTGKMRCYAYVKRYGDSVYIEALSNWESFTYGGGFYKTFTSFQILTNCNQASISVSVPCQS
jgi:hypothetical protein